jgi:ABC-type phosphate transport system substrate-binding protein
MRRPLALTCTGPALAAVVLLAGCGGNSTSASSSTTASTSSAAASSAPLAQTPFCQQATATLSTLAPAVTGGGSDPTKVAPLLQKAAQQVRAIQPPPEIATDWKTLADSLDQFAASSTGVNPNDPAAASAFAQRMSTVIASLSTAAGHVEAYLSTKCGITAPTGLPTAPSS